MQIVRRATSTRKRRIVTVIALGLVAVIGVPMIALAWWLFSPLFNNVTVDEEFPRTVNASIPANVTRAEAETVMDVAAKMDTDTSEEMTPAMAAADAVALVSGEFSDEDFIHRGSGQATIYRLGNGSHVVRLENLSVTNGPDLHVLLLNDPEGEDKSQGYIDLGGLKGNRGNQNYPIPDGEDVAGFRSVMIYCAPFHVIFSRAPLETLGTTGG